MNKARAQEILASCGADVARWPADEQVMLAGLLVDDADLQAARDAACAVDALLDAWLVQSDAAAAEIGGAQAMAARLAQQLPPQVAPSGVSSRRWWLAGMAVAGSMAAALIAVVSLQPPSIGSNRVLADATPPATVRQVAQADADAFVWTTVFTTTEEEERLI